MTVIRMPRMFPFRASVVASWIVVALCSAVGAGAQDLAAERARVLTSIGDTETVDIPLFPLRTGVGSVFSQTVARSGAEFLRLRFAVERTGEAWGVQVLDTSGNALWSTWSEAEDGRTFWSAELDAETVRVEIHSVKPSNQLQLRIDRVVVGRTPQTPVSITGANQLVSIDAVDPDIQRMGESVARLRFVADDGGAFVCTGFLVTPDLLLTNQHCLATQSEVESALVDFDFDGPGDPGLTLGLSELLAVDFELDFSLVRLERCVGRAPLTLDADAVADQDQLMIIQHPAGEPKQVSLRDCTVDGVPVAGRLLNPTDFGHQCDTKGGSSGSPVIHFGRRTVVGLHHLGFHPNSPNAFNRATQMGRVLAALDAALLDELRNGAN